MEERERERAALLMKDNIRLLTSYLLQGQWRRSGQRATLVYLATHRALLLLIFADGGVVHHDQIGVLAIPHTPENILGKPEIENMREQKIFFFFSVYWYSHQSVHQQIFPSVLIAPVNSWRLFIGCGLMQQKLHYVWMDAVPFCRAARQI